MRIVQTGHMAVLAAGGAAASLVPAIYGYRVLSAGGEKADAESLLLAGIVGTAAILTFAVYAYLASKRLLRNFERTTEIARASGVLPAERMARFGVLGDRIRRLFQDLLELGNRRSARIASLAAMTAYLAEFVDRRLLVVDVVGTVYRASGGFLTKREQDGPIEGKPVVELLPGFDARAAFRAAAQSHGPVEAKAEKTGVTVVPIAERGTETAYFIVSLDKIEAARLPDTRKREAKRLEAASGKKGPWSSFVSRWMRKT